MTAVNTSVPISAADPNHPREEYTVNKGSVGQKKIVFIGASYRFVHKILRDFLIVGGFNDVHLVVHDINPDAMNVVADLLERIARQQKSNVKVSRTTSREEALKGADAVFLAITIGGREADQRSWEVCAKYGISVGVGDTMGPACLVRNFRTIPVILQIGRDVERIAPNAVMVNFTNPMSCLTGALARHTSLLTYGICHDADSLWPFMANVFGVHKSQVEIEMAGVNHQAFATKIKIKGVEKTKQQILDAVAAYDAKRVKTDPEEVDSRSFQVDLFKVIGGWPTTGSAHLAEFYEHFYTPRRIEAFKAKGHLRGGIIPGRLQAGPTSVPEIIKTWAYGPNPVGDLELLTTEHAHELLWAVFTGEPFTRMTNVLNTQDQIRGISRNACLEVLTTISGRTFKGYPMTLPPVMHSLIERWTTIHDLSITAAVNCDREAARHALFLDPHVHDLYDIDPMLDDFLLCLKPWMPEKWYK